MKRIISVLILAALVLTMLASCGKPFTCALCREEKTGKQNVFTVLGKEIVYCNDCKKKLDDAGKSIEDLGDDLGKLGDDIQDGINDLVDGIADFFN